MKCYTDFVARIRHALDCVEDVCHQHRIALVEVSRRMEELPQALGYPWAVQRPIQLRHILGHTIDLPLDLFATSEVNTLHPLLVVYAY